MKWERSRLRELSLFCKRPTTLSTCWQFYDYPHFNLYCLPGICQILDRRLITRLLRYTPLHRACWGNEPKHTDTVRALLDAGVPYNQLTPQGQRPIDIVKDNAATKKLLEGRAKKAKEAAAAKKKQGSDKAEL